MENKITNKTNARRSICSLHVMNSIVCDGKNVCEQLSIRPSLNSERHMQTVHNMPFCVIIVVVVWWVDEVSCARKKVVAL